MRKGLNAGICLEHLQIVACGCAGGRREKAETFETRKLGTRETRPVGSAGH